MADHAYLLRRAWKEDMAGDQGGLRVRKPLKPALHHWWPKTLSNYWAANDGRTSQLSWDGKVVRSTPGNFGAIKNAHHIKLAGDSPWNTSFENIFDAADRQFSEVADWLLSLQNKGVVVGTALENRILAQPLSHLRRSQLAECLASLILRSPCTRNKIRETTEQYRKQFGMKDYKADKTLIAMNMQGCYDVFKQAISGGGKFLALVTNNQEFIWGDGFLHNFPPIANPPIRPFCIVPLLPSVTVMFVRPSMFRPEPELMTLLLQEEEVKFLNDVVQIYSSDYVFYRNDRPKIIESFGGREFRQFRFHRHDGLDYLVAKVLDFQ